MAAPLGASPGLTPFEVPNETLDQAIDLGSVSPGTRYQENGSLGGGPDGAADVEWYSFTLDGPARVTGEILRQDQASSFNGVLSLFNNDPYDFADPYDADGYRLLDQVDGKGNGGVASFDELLGPGTYDLAVSGDGNFDFHPLLAGSGLPGSTGDFSLRLVVADAGLESTTGPQVLTTDPAPGSTVSASPLLIRVDLSAPLAYWTVNLNENVQLLSSPDGNFAQDGQLVPLETYNYSDAINELQLFPASPLAPAYYEVILTGQGSPGSVLAGMDGNSLESGQNVTIPFQVDGIEGRVGATTDDSTPATAQELGDVTSAGLVQVAGVIGDDPLGDPSNQVDMYHFTVTGAGNDSLTADVFAGRIGSELAPGVSLFRFDPADDSYQFIAGDINSYNTVTATDGFSTPLYTDSVLYASLTAGDYYLAVTDGTITPSPYEGQAPGSFGIFDPNQPGGFLNNYSPTTGPYVLNLLVQPASSPPHVVSTSPSAGATLTQTPTQLSVTFDEPMNIAQLALQTYWNNSQNWASTTYDTVSGIYIEGADGTEYFPRFESYDDATNTATFVMLDGLPNGNYVLHLSAADGLTDLGGNQLVGNRPNGDYVVPFTVDAPPRGDGGNPLEWSDQEPNDSSSDPQDLGVLFPNELAAGVTITRDFSQDPADAPQDTADVYEFQVLLNRTYSFVLTGDQLPPGVSLSLTDPSGQTEGFGLQGGTLIFAQLTPGTYLLTVSGWDNAQAADVSYQVALTMDTQNDNAPPLLSGPAPAVAIQLASVAPPSSPTSPPPVTPPPVTPPVTTPPVATPPVATPPVTDPSPVDPPSSGGDPSATATAPAAAAITLAIPSQTQGAAIFSGASPLSLVALATSSIGGVIGTEGSQASSIQLVQNAAALPQSALATGLIVLSTSLQTLGPGEDVAATTDEPAVVEPQMTDIEVPRRDTNTTQAPNSESPIPSPAGDLPDLGAMSPPPSVPEPVAGAATVPVAGVAVPGLEVPPVESADQSSRSDDLARSGWMRTRALVLAFTGLALGAYARCRGLVLRDERRGLKRPSARPGMTARRPLHGVATGRVNA